VRCTWLTVIACSSRVSSPTGSSFRSCSSSLPFQRSLSHHVHPDRARAFACRPPLSHSRSLVAEGIENTRNSLNLARRTMFCFTTPSFPFPVSLVPSVMVDYPAFHSYHICHARGGDSSSIQHFTEISPVTSLVAWKYLLRGPRGCANHP